MKRRAFIVGFGSAAACPLVARGQQPRKVPRIGILWHGANEQDEASYLKIFRDSLKELGYVEGKNIELLNQFADERYDRFDVLAKDLIDAKVDVILASTSLGALAAKRISSTTPVVFVIAPDPVGQHLVDSLARPGGNVTGFSVLATDFIGKNLAVC
jgi:putative tryptophan/tyrosine transport system substrate-binding protein